MTEYIKKTLRELEKSKTNILTELASNHPRTFNEIGKVSKQISVEDSSFEEFDESLELLITRIGDFLESHTDEQLLKW